MVVLSGQVVGQIATVCLSPFIAAPLQFTLILSYIHSGQFG